MASDYRDPNARPHRTSGGKSGGPDRDSLRDFVTELVADKINEKVERSTEQALKRAEALERMSDRAAKKAARKAEQLDRLAAHLGAIDVWTRVDPAPRRPRFTRDEIAQAATHIADTEGFGAVSMRRIAAELDAGTMTLYHYVRTKDELLTLVTDAVMAEVVIPPDEAMPPDWRGAIAMLAERSRAALQRHPWILDIADDPAIGPNSVRHFDQSLQAVSSLDISLGEKLDIVSLVDEYVFGYCLHERNDAQPERDAINSDMIAYVSGLLKTGDYPHLQALSDDVGLANAWGQIEGSLRDNDRFARNLGRLLDGIAASLPA